MFAFDSFRNFLSGGFSPFPDFSRIVEYSLP